MTLYLVRHSEVITPYQNCYNGHNNIPLSQKGMQDAATLKEKLKDVEFGAIFCSDLLRTRQTLKQLSPRAKVTLSTKLREKSWGKHEGMSFEQIEASGIKYENFIQWVNALDGETIDAFESRVMEYFHQTIFKTHAENVLVVTHSGVIKIVLKNIKKLSLDEAFSISLPYSEIVTLSLEQPQHK